MINTNFLKTYLWNISGTDPRYSNFLKAAGLEQIASRNKNSFASMLAIHRDRMENYNFLANMYLGNHWFNVSDENLESIKINYAWITVNKHAAFLMNKGFLVESDFPEIEKFLQKNWELNKGGLAEHNELGVNIALMGGTTGDVFLSVLLNKHKETGKTFIEYNVLDSLKCYPVLERGKMRGLLEYGLNSVVEDENNGFTKYDNRYEGYYYRPGSRTRIIGEEPIYTTPFDIIDMPIIHIPNFKNPFSYYGVSDLAQAAKLNLTIDRTITDMQDIVDYSASPVTILIGAKASNLEKAPNRVWGLPKDSSIKNLELSSGGLISATSHLEKLQNAMSIVSNIPESVLGKEISISNTSAAALAIKFMPLYEVMETKRIFYGTQLLNMNAMTIKYAFLTGMLKPQKIINRAIKKWRKEYDKADYETRKRNYPFSDPINDTYDYNSLDALINDKIPVDLYKSYITWFPPLVRDEKANIDTAVSLVKNSIWSRRHARSVLGQTEAESMLMDKEIQEDYKKLINNPEYLRFKTITNANIKSGKVAKKDKTGLEGNPDIKGAKYSQKVSDKL